LDRTSSDAAAHRAPRPGRHRSVGGRSAPAVPQIPVRIGWRQWKRRRRFSSDPDGGIPGEAVGRLAATASATRR
jgi:hypothetical protein